VAGGYKKRLAASSYIKDSQSVPYGQIWQKAADAALATGTAHSDYSRAISDHIMDWVDRGRKPETFLRYNRVPPNAKPAYEAAVKEYVGLQKTPGALYTVDLPDEHIERMLDWDKPLSEQSPYVQKIINDEMKRIGGSAHTGQGAYKELMFESRMQGNKSSSSSMRSNQEAMAASNRLRELGIPGIKYMDEGSRGYVVDLYYKGKPYAEHSGEKHRTLQSAQQRMEEAKAEGFEPKLGTRGTRNFVIFPGEEKNLKILERK
jgi:hypothetical protein